MLSCRTYNIYWDVLLYESFDITPQSWATLIHTSMLRWISGTCLIWGLVSPEYHLKNSEKQWRQNMSTSFFIWAHPSEILNCLFIGGSNRILLWQSAKLYNLFKNRKRKRRFSFIDDAMKTSWNSKCRLFYSFIWYKNYFSSSYYKI